jgi:hypothetical protein
MPEKIDYHKISLEKIAKQSETPDGFIRLSGPLEHDNIVNGDGLRAVLWTQGCPNHCKGCQNPETWDYEAGFLVSIDEIIERLSKFPGQTGLTFCGGEPFVQAKACKEIADRVRKEFGWNVWSFSGFTYEIIKEYGKEVYDWYYGDLYQDVKGLIKLWNGDEERVIKWVTSEVIPDKMAFHHAMVDVFGVENPTKNRLLHRFYSYWGERLDKIIDQCIKEYPDEKDFDLATYRCKELLKKKGE